MCYTARVPRVFTIINDKDDIEYGDISSQSILYNKDVFIILGDYVIDKSYHIYHRTLYFKDSNLDAIEPLSCESQFKFITLSTVFSIFMIYLNYQIIASDLIDELKNIILLLINFQDLLYVWLYLHFSPQLILAI